ncbi:hypothetical protein GCM10007916_31100 [Psychromonas marina]|uniref:CENP-V/GFA domain-containing protein n=1 Tax=Psychromonas marina TaxID=88364 RepID=A0ABQ6E4D8_9GAMM|nr:GFA family protein [Psychromonas marina]GLS92040.1 hypothetical protein GCM10007916_31100 [Psychromonas marina]
MSHIKGSCNCESVKFQISGDIKKTLNCHCKLCRKMNGAVFSTYAVVLTSDFSLLTGKLNSFKVSESATKHFCGKCGTPIYNTNPKFAGLNILHFGSLDLSPELVPDVNIYCESEITWAKSLNTIPSLQNGIE